MFLGMTFNQIASLLLSQLIIGSILFVFTGLNEGRRQRLTANFGKKQEHYADLYEILFKVITGLRLESTNVFLSPNTHDISKLERDLDTKDIVKVMALNHIWASKSVLMAVDVWEGHRKRFMLLAATVTATKDLPLAHGDFGKKKDQAMAELASMDAQLETIKDMIHTDLLINKKGIWKVLAR
jgi:hypothetical protein